MKNAPTRSTNAPLKTNNRDAPLPHITGRTLDFYDDNPDENPGADPQDGDVWLQSRLDAEGRAAVRGRHANLGYSGYYTAYLHAEGGRRRFIGWRDLFPNEENRFRRQADRNHTLHLVNGCIKALRGHETTKVRGGWGFADHDAAIEAATAYIALHEAAKRAFLDGAAAEEIDRLAQELTAATGEEVTAEEIRRGRFMF